MNTTERESMSQRRSAVRACLPKTFLGLCLLFIGLGTAFDATLLAGPPSTLFLSMHNQQVSAHIIRAPLEHVLETLTTHRPFRFIIKGNAKDDLISSSFRHLSFKESLETLLLGYDYAIIHRPLDPTPQTSELRYLMEVVVLSRNPAESSPEKKKPSLIYPQKTSMRPVLLHTSQEPNKPDQSKPSSLGTDNDASDFQATVEEALQDTDPELRELVEELLEE